MGLTQVGTGGIKDDAVTSGKILDSEIETSDIKDGAVTTAKLANGTENGKVLTSNDGSAPTFNTPTVEGTAVTSDGITATSPYKFLRADGDGTCSWQAPAGTSVVSTGTNGDGLAPARPDNNQSDVFLRGDATWAVPNYATSLVTDQANGLAPILPTTDPTLKFLRGDRSWQELNYTVSGTTTGDAGTDASVSLSGTEFSFTIPKGDQGIPGAAATIGVHSTETGDAGTDASVTNEGSSSAANFKFTIPRGNIGNTGASGKTILNGSGAPDGTTGGNIGDFYIDTTNNDIYGPKESGGWVGSATSLVGPAGQDGVTQDISGKADTSGDTFTGNINLNDDVRLRFGTNNDISFYHNDTHFYLNNQKGNLHIRTSKNESGTQTGGNVVIRGADDVYIQANGGDDGIKVKGEGAVELYHNNAKTLETTSTGIDITGDIVVSGSVDGIADLNTTVTANTAKVTNATHTGDVTGDTALTIADDKIEEKHINAGGTAGAGKVLVYDSSATGNWKWDDQSGSGGGSGTSDLIEIMLFT